MITKAQVENKLKEVLLSRALLDFAKSPNGKNTVLLVELVANLCKQQEEMAQKLTELESVIDEKVGPEGQPGEKGEDGETPDSDEITEKVLDKIPLPEDGRTPTEEELLKLIIPLIPKPEDGKTPTKKELTDLIKPLIPKPQKGKDAIVDYDLIVKEAVKLIKPPKEATFTPETVLGAISDLPEDKKLTPKHIKGLDEAMHNIARQYLHGGGDTVKAGSGVSITPSSDGSKIISVSGNGFQVPTSGVINGSNLTFVWATAPNVIIVDGGRAMQKTSSDGAANWTGATTTILTIAPNNDIFSTA